MELNVNIENIIEKCADLGINYDLMESYHCLFKNYNDFFNREKRIKTVYKFLSANGHRSKEKYAIELIKNHWEVHSKEPYYKYLKALSDIEPGIQKYNKNHRDHLVHTAYVFLLGLHLFKLNKNIRKAIKNYFRENRLESYSPQNSNGREIFDSFFKDYYGQIEPSNNLELFRFIWLLISTFHDLSYPFESFICKMAPYITHINNLGKDQSEYVPTSIELPFKGMEVLSSGNSFKILNKLQKDYDKEGNYLDLEKYLKDRLNKGFVDHGIISALLLLKTSDVLYIKKNWKKRFFDKTFPPIALGIALHNIDWKYAKDNYDKLPKITLEDFPLCYLLILADTLQEWDRPSKKSNIGSKDISIKFDQEKGKFIVKIDLSEKRINEIIEELQIKLSSINIPIIEKAL
jgi:hypothetical protein